MGGVICWEVCYFLRSQCLGVFGFAIQDSNGRAKRPRRLFPWVFEVKWLIFGRFLGFCHDAASVARALRCVLKIQLRTPEGRRVALFHPTSCIMGEPTRHQYRRGYDASPTRMAAPFAPGFARSCVWRQLLAVNGQPVVAGLVLCRRPILPGDRVQKVPSPFPPRSGCLNIEMIFDITEALAKVQFGVVLLQVY